MGYTMTIRKGRPDEFQVRLLSKIPGFLEIKMVSMAGMTGKNDKELIAYNQIVIDILRYAVEPEDRDEFEEYLMSAEPVIEVEEVMGIYDSVLGAYSGGNSQSEESNNSSDGSTAQIAPTTVETPQPQDKTESNSTDGSSSTEVVVSKS